MIIGIDIDGTLDRHPDFYREFGRSMMNSGHEIWYITGVGDWSARVEQLKGYGIYPSVEYTEVYVVDNGHTPDILGPIKANFCKIHNVDLMIDDMIEVVEACLDLGVMALLAIPIFNSSHLFYYSHGATVALQL